MVWGGDHSFHGSSCIDRSVCGKRIYSAKCVCGGGGGGSYINKSGMKNMLEMIKLAENIHKASPLSVSVRRYD